MILIIGLGNPSPEYENTFHNMGFMAVDRLAEKLNKKIKKAECSALTSTFSVDNDKVILAKPMTYMNLSGEAAKSLASKYGAAPADILVIYDDFDLPRFTLRARAEGGPGTHNGMKSVIAELGTQEFKRIRVGIGKEDAEAKDYVLSTIRKEDAAKFDETLDYLAGLLQRYIKDKLFDNVIRDCTLFNKSVK
jgi:PTH1 family peptidyl-tRNA hydrolase